MMRTIRRQKIRWQMILAITFVSILAVTVSVFSVYHISRKNIETHYIQMEQDRLEAFELLVDKELENEVQLIRQYMLDDSLINEIREAGSTETESHEQYYFPSQSRVRLAKICSGLFNQLAKPEGIFLFDNEDHYYMHLRSGKNTSPYLKYYRETIDKDSDWYRTLSKSRGREIFWNTDVLNPENDDCFSVMKKLYDTSKYQPQGILIITMEKTLLTQLYSQLNSDNIVMLLDEQDHFLVQIGQIDDKDDEGVYSFYQAYQERNSEGNNEYLFLEKKDELTSWKFITGIRKSELYKQGEFLHTYLWILFPLVILAALLISVLVANTINKPLEKLKNAVEEINAGAQQIETQFGDDEIGEIGNTVKRVINDNLLLEKKIAQTQLSEKNAQYELLQSQINPHYLYNTLDSIYLLARKHGDDDISRMVLALSEMFRTSLNEGKSYVTVRDELEYIRNYMITMNYRFHDRFSIIFDVDEEMMDLFLLKLLIQPFVENSVIHGLEPKKDSGTIIISGTLEDDEMEFCIYDDGVGFAPDMKTREGFGIRNVTDRIHLIYGPQYQVNVSSTPGEGTKAVLRLPVKEESFFQNKKA